MSPAKSWTVRWVFIGNTKSSLLPMYITHLTAKDHNITTPFFHVSTEEFMSFYNKICKFQRPHGKLGWWPKKMFEIEWIKFLQCAPPPSLILKALRKREKWEKLTPEIPFLASFKIKKVYFCQCCPHAHKNCVSKETPTTVKVPGHNGTKIIMNLHCFFMNFNFFIMILFCPPLLIDIRY